MKRIWLIEKRKSKFRTQRELAKLLGVTHQAVNNWEMGHSLPNKTIMPKLCDILKITPKRFYEQEKKKDEKSGK